VVVHDATSEDGAHAGSPGYTRLVEFRAGRFTEVRATLPWLGAPATAIARSAGARDVAIVRRTDGGAKLVMVDARGRLREVAALAQEPSWMGWIGGTLVGWGPTLDGWRLPARATAPVPIAVPAGAPEGWQPVSWARIGDELCAWGGGTPTHHVLGAVCLDPRKGTTRLLAAPAPPRSFSGMCQDWACSRTIRWQVPCKVVVDDAPLLTCNDEPGLESLWVVEPE
jgi:hypothetical protein